MIEPNLFWHELRAHFIEADDCLTGAPTLEEFQYKPALDTVLGGTGRK